MLPFLKDKDKWPSAREPSERIVADKPSEDQLIEELLSDSDRLQEHLITELLSAIESKNASEIKDILIALIHSLNLEEENYAAKQVG